MSNRTFIIILVLSVLLVVALVSRTERINCRPPYSLTYCQNHPEEFK